MARWNSREELEKHLSAGDSVIVEETTVSKRRTNRHEHAKARKIRQDGYTFDSRDEHTRYIMLVAMEYAGEISDLRVHPSWTLIEACELDGKSLGDVTYSADFMYVKDGVVHIEDVKGTKTGKRGKPVFRIERDSKLRMRLFMERYIGQGQNHWHFDVVDKHGQTWPLKWR